MVMVLSSLLSYLQEKEIEEEDDDNTVVIFFKTKKTNKRANLLAPHWSS